MKKLSAILMACAMTLTMATTTFAMSDGAYQVKAGINYWNPDTGEINDGGTANAALGEGMCRSVTGTKALVEKEGDSYYVTLRLLLQSDTYDAKFWTRTGYDTYKAVSYDIMAENAVADSVDYRFQVADPFQPIKATMYVIPMGRETLWYIELDKNSIENETGDFIVSVSTTVEEIVEEPVVEITPELEEAPVVEEIVETIPETATETEPEVETTLAETVVETQEPEVDVADEEVLEEVEVLEEELETEAETQEEIVELDVEEEVQDVEDGEVVEEDHDLEETLEETQDDHQKESNVNDIVIAVVSIGLGVLIGWYIVLRKRGKK